MGRQVRRSKVFSDKEMEELYEKAAKLRDDNEGDEYLEGVVSALGWALGREDHPLEDYE